MPRFIKEVAIPLAGIGLAVNEAVFRHGEPRFYLLVLAAAMMGLSAFLKLEDVVAVLDRMRRANGNGNGHHRTDRPDEKAKPALAVAVTRLALFAVAWRYA